MKFLFLVGSALKHFQEDKFSAYDEEKKRKNSDVYDCIIRDKVVCNTWNDINLNEQNPYVKMYSDRIDFDKYNIMFFWCN